MQRPKLEIRRVLQGYVSSMPYGIIGVELEAKSTALTAHRHRNDNSSIESIQTSMKLQE